MSGNSPMNYMTTPKFDHQKTRTETANFGN